MNKEIEVKIISKSQLELLEDAKKGDIINLDNLKTIDNSIILKVIDANKDQIYNQKINELKEKIKLEEESYNLKILRENEKKYNEKINELNLLISELKKDKEILENKLSINEDLKKDEIKNKELEIKNNYLKEITDLNNEIDKLKTEKRNILENQNIKEKLLKSQYEAEKTTEISKLKEDFNLEKNNYQNQINQLSIAKSSLNVKRLGEELEQWCLSEYQKYSMNGFYNCEFYKDNTAIKEEGDNKGTKADFIFKIYKDENKDETNLLTSVCLEMKNESNLSTNKKKNEDHFDKLNKDRNKKGLEYALLVTELEWDNENDFVIRKIPNYPKMYMVRPQYFVTFLSLIDSLSKKYQEIILAKRKEDFNFKTKAEIEMEFNNLKTTYFDKPLATLEKEVQEMLKKTQISLKAMQEVESILNNIINKTLFNIKNKIETYSVKQKSFIKKIDSLEE